MKLCNFPATAECRAFPCRGCEPCEKTREEMEQEEERNIVLSQITEDDADALHDFIFAAEIADSKPDVDEYWLDETAKLADGATTHRCNCTVEPAQLVHQPNERTASLDEWWNEKYSAAPYSAQPPVYVKGHGFTNG